jgi:uridylate kinase
MRPFKRILLKLSGEMLAAEGGRGLAGDSISAQAEEIREAHATGTQIAVVIGAGNLVRGAGPNRHDLEISQQHMDTMGMLATAINCTALKDQLESIGVPAVHMSAFTGIPFTTPLDARKAQKKLAGGAVVLFSGGTGLPFFSTDTAAVVRGLQIEADAVLKATQVDGIYDRDPKEPGAQLLTDISHAEALSKQLRFMDLAALALSAQHQLTIHVFNAHKKGNLARAVRDDLQCSRMRTK